MLETIQGHSMGLGKAYLLTTYSWLGQLHSSEHGGHDKDRTFLGSSTQHGKLH
jgi:hypothetical protein